jgi:hypothetical protein
MKEVKISKPQDASEWEIVVFEIGNTYQIAATNTDKVVHFMLNKREYLDMLLAKQNGRTLKENENLYCTGREFLSESEFEAMKSILFTHMDADLSEEKFLYGIVPEQKE